MNDLSAAAETITLEVPADPSSLAVVRVFAGTLGRDRGWDSPTIEDLKMVLSELSAAAVGTPARGARIEISATPEGDRLVFRFNGIGGGSERRGDEADARRSLLDALVPSIRYEKHGAGGIVATFRFPPD